MTTKPKLTVEQCLWFDKVDRVFRGYPQVGPARIMFYNVWMGDLTEHDVLPLIRLGLLRRFPWWAAAGYSREVKLGERFSVELTDKALRIFWPEQYLRAISPSRNDGTLAHLEPLMQQRIRDAARDNVREIPIRCVK